MLQRRRLNAGKHCENTQRLPFGVLIVQIHIEASKPLTPQKQASPRAASSSAISMICLLYARDLSRRSRRNVIQGWLKVARERIAVTDQTSLRKRSTSSSICGAVATLLRF
jgi:hypothetical protein